MRVLKGKKLAGHMGSEVVTIQNLEIIEVNEKENYILVSGNVPGPKKSLVLIKSAVKGGASTPKEIVSYETVTDEVTPEAIETETVEVVENVQNTEAAEATEVTETEATEETKEIEETQE
jgi:large subunit ribosomal protein L3